MKTSPPPTGAVSNTTASTADKVSNSNNIASNINININNDDKNDDNSNNNKKKAVRHAEKRRTGTCQFSNRVAAISVQHYRQHMSRMFQQTQKQTCLATIVAHERLDSIPPGSFHVDDDHDDATTIPTDRLTVVGMGVGTKFLSESVLQEHELRNKHKLEREGEEEEEEESYGSRVRDCHAEVLARRAFRCHLSLEMKRLVQNQLQQQRDQEQQDPVDSILECVVVRSTTATTSMVPQPPRLAFRLRPGVTLHLYSSSAPCGNACLKKFATMQAEVFREDLCSTEWPAVDKSTHEYTPGHSLPLGQFSLLVKKDSAVESMSSYEDYQKQHINNNNSSNNHNKKRGRVDGSSEDSGAIAVSTATTTAASTEASVVTTAMTSTSAAAPDRTTKGAYNDTSDPTQTKKPAKNSKSPAHWPANVTDTWCPPGTTTVWSGRGSLHTCSDKICRWNCLGLQGSLLSALMVVDPDPNPDQQNNQPQPLYLSTATVGRKLTAVTCRRAICCRVGPTDHDTAKRNGNSSSSSSSILPGPYLRLHHPTVMGTSVYMDDTGVIDMSSRSDTDDKGQQQQTTGQDVRFHSTLSWAWWPALSTKNGAGREAECIDGATGWVILPRHDADATDTNVYDDSSRTTRSMVSTASLLELYLQIDQAIQQWTLAARSRNGNGASAMEVEVEAEVDTKLVPRTLTDLRSLKKQVSRPYEDAKEQLLTKHPVLRQWKRRENRLFAG